VLLFFSTRRDIIQSNKFAAELATEAAAVFCREFRDTSKTTAKYLSEIKGEKSVLKIKSAEKRAGIGVDASNSVSESLHSTSMLGLEVYGSTLRMDHSAAEGQTRTNNDFGRMWKKYVKGKKSLNSKMEVLGAFHKLCPELQDTIIQAAREYAARNRRDFDEWLNRQKASRRRKEVAKLEKEYANALEDYIVALYFFEQYHSPCCWHNAEIAREEYGRLTSE